MPPNSRHITTTTAPLTAILATGTPTTLHVQIGNPVWILDSGANDHMIGELSLFSSSLSPIAQTVRIADGSTIVYIRNKGDVSLSPHITLTSVLHVLNFAYNLLSVSRLTRDLDCVVLFSPHSCLLQDRISRKIFGRGYERDGLYYFSDPPRRSVISSGLQASILHE